MNSTTAAWVPPGSVDQPLDDDSDPPPVEVTLTGDAARSAIVGAAQARMSVGDFVIESTMAVAAMGDWEAKGFRILAQDRYGREFDLTPAVMGLKPPPSL